MSATTTADEVPPEARPLSEEEQKTFDGMSIVLNEL
jgi:hypothetical protein